MFTQQEIKQLKKEFWTRFGQYMQPLLSASGQRVNWLNYKTGVKDIYFRIDATQTAASIAIELSHKDQTLRHQFFQKMKAFQPALESLLDESWQWQEEHIDEFGRSHSRISIEITNVNVLDRHSWPALISFFKPRMIALDAFWTDVRDFFIV